MLDSRTTQVLLHIFRPVGAEGDGGAIAPPDFDIEVNPISTKEADYAHHIATPPPGFSDVPTVLICIDVMVKISILIHGVQVLAHVCPLSSITAGKSNSIQIPTKIDPFFTVNFIVLGHRTQINTFQTNNSS